MEPPDPNVPVNAEGTAGLAVLPVALGILDAIGGLLLLFAVLVPVVAVVGAVEAADPNPKAAGLTLALPATTCSTRSPHSLLPILAMPTICIQCIHGTVRQCMQQCLGNSHTYRPEVCWVFKGQKVHDAA